MDQDRVTLVDGLMFRKLLKSFGSQGVAAQRVAVAKSMVQAPFDAKMIDTDNRIVPFTISTASVDREGDTIAVEGWRLDNYRKNPVVLFGHDHYQPPVAQSLTEYTEGGRLKSRAQFMPREMSEFAYSIFQMYVGGYMRATSVGFIPEKWEYAEEGERAGKGLNFSEQEMIEYSCVPVPANPEALIEARAKGINTRPFREWASRVLDEAKQPKSASRGVLERLHELSDPTGRRIFASLQEIRLTAEDAQVAVVDAEAFLGKDGGETLAIDEAHPDVEEEEDDDLVLDDGPDEDGGGDVPDDNAPAGEPDPVLETGQPEFRAATDTREPLRWNRTWSKAFDVDRAQFPPGNAILGLASNYIGCEVKHLVRFGDGAFGTRMGAYLTALDQSLSEARVDDLRNLDRSDKEWPPQHELVQLNSTRRATFLVHGIRFMEWRGVKLVLRVEPDWGGIDLTVYAQKGEGADKALQLLDETSKTADTFKFLKGEAFTLSGEFMQRGNTTLDDVFLEPRNQKAIARAIELLNNKAGEMEPRGMMLLGPPGTGKTLSGRVLRDQVKGTFIHVAARDLARRGSFYGMLEAIKVARQNDPAVVFIEDVDNFMDDYTVDMLKTEMDGLTQHKGILIVLTTNYPERMPKALIDRPGRFHDVCRFGLPDDKVRLRMVQRWMPELTPEQQLKAVKETAGYSGAHVRELARFAEILREQDDLDIGTALDQAIDKMREQRDIITASQTAGSRYRAPVSVERQAPATGGVVENGTLQLHGDTIVPLAAYARLAGGIEASRVGDVVHVKVDGLTLSKAGRMVMSVDKAGRVLSGKNESALKEAVDAIYAAADKLKGVLAQVQQQPEADASEGGSMDDDDKAAAAPAAALKAVDDDVVEAEHVLVLDDEMDIGEIDAEQLREAVSEVSREAVMMLTGRIW
jgi:SpoVK/Ycf46/Vps4 family AAA+-type ATPase